VAFNIGKQQAGVINNVAGDQTIYGDQHGSVTIDTNQGRVLLAKLRRELRVGELAAGTRSSVESELDACEAELDQPQPSSLRLRDRLANIAHILVSAGAVVSAGTGLGAALGALAGWLGGLGEPIRRLLPEPSMNGTGGS
jgi:hypothetical protein